MFQVVASLIIIMMTLELSFSIITIYNTGLGSQYVWCEHGQTLVDRMKPLAFTFVMKLIHSSGVKISMLSVIGLRRAHNNECC